MTCLVEAKGIIAFCLNIWAWRSHVLASAYPFRYIWFRIPVHVAMRSASDTRCSPALYLIGSQIPHPDSSENRLRAELSFAVSFERMAREGE